MLMSVHVKAESTGKQFAVSAGKLQLQEASD